MTQGRNDLGPKWLTYLGRNDPPQKLAKTIQAEMTQGWNDPDSSRLGIAAQQELSYSTDRGGNQYIDEMC